MVEQQNEPAPAFSDFCELKARRLAAFLSRSPSWLQQIVSPSADPELRKTLGRIYSAVQDALRLGGPDPDGSLYSDQSPQGRAMVWSPFQRSTFQKLIDFDPNSVTLDAALELADEADMFLIVGADKEYLAKALSVELAYEAGTALSWQKLYKDSAARGGAGNIPDLLDKLREDDDQKAVFEAKQRLLGMKSARSHDYRRHRARQKMKMLYLWLLAPALLILTLVFGGLAVEYTDVGAGDVLLIAFAGAVGATLAAAYKLRDELKLGSELREFRPAIVVNPLIGATSGLVLLLAFQGELVKLTGSGDAIGRAAFGFMAGFSEPFFLGITHHIAGLSDKND